MSAREIEVVILEDSSLVALQVQRGIERLAGRSGVPCTCLVYDDVDRALRQHAARPFDVAVVDLNLADPRRPGEAFILAARRRYPALRVVVFSGLEARFDADRLAALAELSPDAILPKPTPSPAVAAMVLAPWLAPTGESSVEGRP